MPDHHRYYPKKRLLITHKTADVDSKSEATRVVTAFRGCSGDDLTRYLSLIQARHLPAGPDPFRRVGLGIAHVLHAEKEEAKRKDQSEPCTLVIDTGDIIYPHPDAEEAGLIQQLRKFFFEPYFNVLATGTPVLAVLGNHEEKATGFSTDAREMQENGQRFCRVMNSMRRLEEGAPEDAADERPIKTHFIETFYIHLSYDHRHQPIALYVYLDTSSLAIQEEQKAFIKNIHCILKHEAVADSGFTSEEMLDMQRAKFKIVIGHHAPLFSTEDRTLSNEERRYGGSFSGSNHLRMIKALEQYGDEHECPDLKYFFHHFDFDMAAHAHTASVSAFGLPGLQDTATARFLSKVTLGTGKGGAMSNGEVFDLTPALVDTTSGFAGFHTLSFDSSSEDKQAILTYYDCTNVVEIGQAPALLWEMTLTFTEEGFVEISKRSLSGVNTSAQINDADARERAMSAASDPGAVVAAIESRMIGRDARGLGIPQSAAELLLSISSKIFKKEKTLMIRFCELIQYHLRFLPLLLAAEAYFIDDVHKGYYKNSDVDRFLSSIPTTEEPGAHDLQLTLNAMSQFMDVMRKGKQFSSAIRQLLLIQQLLCSAYLQMSDATRPRTFVEALRHIKQCVQFQLNYIEPETFSPREEEDDALPILDSVVVPSHTRALIAGATNETEDRTIFSRVLKLVSDVCSEEKHLCFAAAHPAHADSLTESRRFMLVYLMRYMPEFCFHAMRGFLMEAEDPAIVEALERTWGAGTRRNEIDHHDDRCHFLFAEKIISRILAYPALATQIFAGAEVVRVKACIQSAEENWPSYRYLFWQEKCRRRVACSDEGVNAFREELLRAENRGDLMRRIRTRNEIASFFTIKDEEFVEVEPSHRGDPVALELLNAIQSVSRDPALFAAQQTRLRTHPLT